ncbi:MAG: T9SS type A sorting domain-containing protein [Flavipsychrobacter sp.]
MKLKISMLIAAIFMAHLSYGQITDPAPYCEAGYDDSPTYWPHYISNVTFGSLNNTSGDTQFAAPHYVYYNNITAPDLIAGHTYRLSVAHDDGLHFMAAYIDYNQNHDFYDAGEKVLQQKDVWGSASITNPSVASITIPVTATPGITRMRIMAFEDDYYTWTDSEATPCTGDSLEWGETEDYNINILPPTGIAEINKNNTDLFYPNPAKDVIYADQSFIGKEMIIYNVEGKVIQRGMIRDKKMDVSGMPPGQYIIKVIENSSVYTQRFSIMK